MIRSRRAVAAFRPSMFAALLLLLASAASAATFAVTKTSDTDDGVCNADCSIREALTAANASAGTDTITLPPGTFDLSLDFLTFQSGIILRGSGAGVSIIDGGDTVPIAICWAGAVVRIEGVTMRNGRSTGPVGLLPLGGGLSITSAVVEIVDSEITGNDSYGRGGGLLIGAFADVTLRNVRVEANTAVTDGGGIAVGALNGPQITADLVVIDSAIDQNIAADGGGLSVVDGTVWMAGTSIDGNDVTGKGGGVWVFGDVPVTQVTILRSTIDGNDAAGEGGGLLIEGLSNAASFVTVRETSISGNDSVSGGGVSIGAALSALGGAPEFLFEDVTFEGNGANVAGGGLTVLNGNTTIRNSTLSGNGSVDGGGLRLAGGVATLDSVTFASNQATGSGAAVFADAGQVVFANTIVVGDCVVTGGAVVNSVGGNLESPGATCLLGGTGDQFSVPSAGLLGLADNGGFTRTHALQGGSAAAGNGLAGNCLATDQRGLARAVPCDVGSFEDGPEPPIFSDDFEGFSLGRWSSVVNDA